MDKIPILRCSKDQFVERCVASLGKGKDHARLAYTEWMRSGRFQGSDAAFNNAAGLQDSLSELIDGATPVVKEVASEGDLSKILFEIGVEAVVLPMRSGWTLCISSQVGCAMGCSFCETGKMGLLRNLRAEEIVGQVWVARHQLGVPVRNLVFMGMGEPLDNYEEVMRAVDVLTDQSGLAFGSSNITISTCGRVDEIYRLIEDASPSLNLAVSVNAPNDEVRRKIMPINRKHSMADLKAAMVAYCEHPRRKIFAEYVMLAGVNDSVAAAKELVSYLDGVRAKINLIPYNPGRRDRFTAPSEEVMEQFATVCRNAGYLTYVRQTKGQEVLGACGQLRTERRVG